MVSQSCGRENYLTLQIQEMHVVGAGVVRMGDTETHTMQLKTRHVFTESGLRGPALTYRLRLFLFP